MIHQISCLTDQECDDYKQKVIELKPLWSLREKGPHTFHTLGTCSYLDAVDNYDLYQSKRVQTNLVLESYFSKLNKKVCEALESIFKIPVQACHSMALPGFHIFQTQKNPEPTIHFDGQYSFLKWPYQSINKEKVFSFTLALELPQEGGGLNMWPILFRDYEKLNHQEKQKILMQKFYLPYTVGILVVHEDLIMHQVSYHQNIALDEKRITYQGHGILADGKYRIYW